MTVAVRLPTVVRSRTELARALPALRSRTGRIALVPTMGALHEGHLRLFDRAVERADGVVASVFVNPLQFGPGEDLDRYPRDPERDFALAAGRGVDLVFAPEVSDIYPDGPARIRVTPGPMGEGLCGPFRPGHFEGVLTVVAKLLGLVRPDLAVFGRKDLQQAALIRRMVHDLELGVEIDVAPLVRDADGMALSSRNAYLSEEDRVRGRRLSHGLAAAAADFRDGERAADRLLNRVRAEVDAPGLELQYVALVDPDTLDPLSTARPGAALAAAAVVGRTRLIDNVLLGAASPDPVVSADG